MYCLSHEKIDSLFELFYYYYYAFCQTPRKNRTKWQNNDELFPVFEHMFWDTLYSQTLPYGPNMQKSLLRLRVPKICFHYRC